jgi:hypothetical protein
MRLFHIPQSIEIVDIHWEKDKQWTLIFSPSNIFPLGKLGLLLNREHVRGLQSTRTIDLKVIDRSTIFPVSGLEV